CTHSIFAAAEPAGSAPTAHGNWGFDLAGADFAHRPGDDFFRYSNGAWYDRAIIPPDRSSTGVDMALNITNEAPVREIVERGEAADGTAQRAAAANIGAFYAAFMDDARAEALDATPIAPVLDKIHEAATREDVADLMGAGRQSFFSSVFGLGIGADDKAPDKYAVSVRQGGLGLNRDYYITPRLAEKKAA